LPHQKGPSDAKLEWELLPESTFTGTGGDAERKPEAVSVSVNSDAEGMFFKAPFTPGPYRLFIYITSPNQRVAYDNFPFFVE